MTTADLIEALAGDAAPTPPIAAGRRVAWAVLGGAAAAFAVLLVWLGLRPLGDAVMSASFWMKGAYTATLALAGLLLVGRLARPGARPGAWPAVATAAVAVMVALAALELSHARPGEIPALWLGQTWDQCPFRIVALAVPVFVGVIWVLRGLAPTRLALAGAAAGLLAGAAGATVYGLYCQETTAAFVATWYTLGIAACAALGAAAGRWLLRW